MIYDRYEADLQRVHESEVYGAAVFATAAKLSRGAERQRKWRRLKALEDQTQARYLEHMRRTGQPVRKPRGAALRGKRDGAALALLPWGAAMRLVRGGTQPFLQCFERLRSHGSEDHRAFFAYVYAHEKAIEGFANAELRGEHDSLRAVEALLEHA